MPSNPQRSAYLIVAGVAAIFLFRLAWHWLAPIGSFVSQTPDDAYYYFQVARHVAAGAGSTFDGVNMTNGYHPLWLLVCSAVALAFDPAGIDLSALENQARTLLSLQWFVAVGGLVLLLRAIKPLIASNAWVLAVAACALPPVIYGCSDGLESGLVLLLVGAVIVSGLREAPLGPRPVLREFEWGALLSLAFLVRLDLALLCVSIGVYTTIALIRRRIDARTWLRKGLAWGIPVVAVALVYFIINQAMTGESTPISGSLKSTFPHPSGNRAHLPHLVMGAGLFVLTALGSRLTQHPGCRQMLVIGALFQATHLVYTALFMSWGVHAWHLTGFWPFALLATGVIADRFSERRRLLTIVAATTLLAGIVGQVAFLKGRSERAFQAQSYQAALWARQNVAGARLIGMSDCGVFGYFRGGGVVNLDGLINNRDYQNHLASQGLASYLHAQGIGFIAHHAVPAERIDADSDPYIYTRRAHRALFVKGSPTIELWQRDILYKGPAFADGRGVKHFVVWKWSRRPAL